MIRRARPLLGTIVDLGCDGSSNAIAAAFAVIEKVQRLMSFHDPASDISRINHAAYRRKVIMHPWTWRVLKAALDFSRKSDGVFDVTAARSSDGNWHDVLLEGNFAVRFRRRVIVDLGGIAKGFGVDCAVDALKRRAVPAGIVNAGGDIRVFGSTTRTIHLRHPISPMQFAGAVHVHDRAIATSANYFTPGALTDGQKRRAMTDLVSVTVAARDCMTADALTKIVFVLREKAAPLLARHRADALLLERDASPSWMFYSPCVTRDRNRFD